MKKYIRPEELAKIKKIDLLTYLSNYEPNELVRKSNNDFITKSHSSLHISNGMWMWWAKGIGGKSALDYLIKVCDMPFLDAALLIQKCIHEKKPEIKKAYRVKLKPDYFRLPAASESPDAMMDYLVNKRCIDKEIVIFYYQKGYIYQCLKDNSVVFVGYDNNGRARFGCKRATNDIWKKDIYGSDKSYSFRYENRCSQTVHVFESPIDLMSFQTLEKQKKRQWNHENYLSLSGVAMIGRDIQETELPIALENFLMNNKQVTQIYLHLDNDRAGYETSEKINFHLGDRYEIIDQRPRYYKDVNEVLSKKLVIKGMNAVR